MEKGERTPARSAMLALVKESDAWRRVHKARSRCDHVHNRSLKATVTSGKGKVL